MKPTLRKTAELAMIRAIPELIVNEVKPGRLKSILIKLVIEVDCELEKLPSINTEDLSLIKKNNYRIWEKIRMGKRRTKYQYFSFILPIND